MAAPGKSKEKGKHCDVANTSTGAQHFVEGSIVRITMENFLTYSYSVVRPGPNLNVILGANGTGKSSIVCAICLGLAGKTSILGRAEKVGLYVKRGCSKGSVEIELYKEGGNVVVTREISMENNQSVWMLNGRQSSQKAVEEAVKALHIQVGNLCQFLPQEKVGEFAKMSKIERLEATEKSIGPPEMYALHCDLKNFRTKERQLESVIKEKASLLEKAKQRNERNKHDSDRYFQKLAILRKVEVLEKKKSWVEYDNVRIQLDGLKKVRDEAKQSHQTLKEAQTPMLKKIQAIDKQLKPIENQIKNETTNIREAARRFKEKQDQLENKNRVIEDIRHALSLKQTEEADRLKRIDNTRQMIADLQTELNRVGDQPDVVPQINAINAELRQIQEERAKIEEEKADLLREKGNRRAEALQSQRKLNDMNNLMTVKEEKLRACHQDTHTAIQWLRENKHLFTGNVYEPMMLVINVKDPRFAKYVESHISFSDLRAFVFQKKEDMEKFMKEVRDKLKLKVNTISAPRESCSNRSPSRPLESLKQFGFYSYLREMFDAPEEVMSYLCNQYRVYDVPVGTDQTKTMIKTVIKEPNLRVLYTTEDRYTVKRSLYSNHLSTNNSAVKSSQFLTISVDAEDKRRLQETISACEKTIRGIDDQLRAMQGSADALDRRDNELRNEKKQLSEFKAKKRQLEQKISTKQDSLKQMEQGGIDLRKAEEDTKTKISAAVAQKVAIAAELLSHVKRKAHLSKEKVRLSLEIVALTAAKTQLEDDCRESNDRLKEMAAKCAQLDQRISPLTETCRVLLKKAKEICNVAPGEQIVSLDLHQSFSAIPGTVEEIDALLNEMMSQMECYSGLNEDVVDEYTRRQEEIEKLQTELEENTRELATYRQTISEAKNRWLNPLKQLVGKTNEKFSDFFRSMQCAGEVDLHTENEEEYDKYGICIRVKFRSSEQLHELTAHHQSGGERSVATMLYLMSLQELNRCPFRVVDEINQGMDPVNERRVFDIVVRTASEQTTSQYFFITPKLLQNLEYGKKMTILCVHNGPSMLPALKWDDRAFIRRAKKRRQKL